LKTEQYIIAIGASAGGMNQINTFFDFTPLDGVSYIVIQHLYLQVENIYFNKPYMENVLISLLSNAFNFRSPERPLRIDISTKQKPNGEVLMIIKDNGIGIDLTRHQEKIFGLYQRFHSNSASVGLGLFIVKSQINSLGGKIEVESEVDAGTAFKITFLNKGKL
jgi:signal transduction histidine kinase